MIYGSYDCPEVWVLRRYRDYCLGVKLIGKIIIKIYYIFSPTLVWLFGSSKRFKTLIKPQLDKFVKKLKDNGMKDTIYFDK